MDLARYNEIAERDAPSAAQYRAAVISIHGMNTRGSWQKQLTPHLQDAAIRHVPLDYGNVLVGVVRKRTLNKIVERLEAEYERQQHFHARPGVIAHSLGTLATGHALRIRPDLALGRSILFGCILPCDFPWETFIKRKQVYGVLHEFAENDRWPRLARWLIPGAGDSGSRGFDSCPSQIRELRYKWTAHSELQNAMHYRRVWIPFLTGHDED